MDRPTPASAKGGASPVPGGEVPGTGRIVAFVVLAYAFSWALWLPLAIQGVVVEPGQGWPTHLLGLMGPAAAAILVTAATNPQG
jgi:hypothetical protein